MAYFHRCAVSVLTVAWEGIKHACAVSLSLNSRRVIKRSHLVLFCSGLVEKSLLSHSCGWGWQPVAEGLPGGRRFSASQEQVALLSISLGLNIFLRRLLKALQVKAKINCKNKNLA